MLPVVLALLLILIPIGGWRCIADWQCTKPDPATGEPRKGEFSVYIVFQLVYCAMSFPVNYFAVDYFMPGMVRAI